ncbi:hypothetical protein GQ44DRAFT_704861 [Phaeosphaeriaceae sp. PMI808]|nr:hypothetical protein GQ44DRAFT_704861 [Phaeosphaeriaceae sp. PMI808]
MDMLDDISPHLGPTQLAAGHAPPTPPYEGPLDDIYGSEPTSPITSGAGVFGSNLPHDRSHEILSDLPSRQRALDTDAYREGLSVSKGQYVQEGFDEGYSLGANLGVRVGFICGVLQGFVESWKGHNEQIYQETKKVYDAARKELAIEELLGQNWVNEEGVWKWEVHGEEEDPTFREVAEQHPVLQIWTSTVESMASKWGVDLKAVEKSHEPNVDES